MNRPLLGLLLLWAVCSVSVEATLRNKLQLRSARRLRAAQTDAGRLARAEHVGHMFRGRHERRTLLQGFYDAATTESGVQCSLSQSTIDSSLDATTRTWRITDNVLDIFENDLQEIFDCTEEGDTVLFDVTGNKIKLSARVTISRPLTISADTDERDYVNGIFPEAPRTSLICPRENEGVFYIKYALPRALFSSGWVCRAASIVIANIGFEDCVFEASGSIVEFAACNATETTLMDTVQLHHVHFNSNYLVGAVGLNFQSPSCSALEMVDVEFLQNECSGICGAVLSQQNVLTDITVSGNQLTSSVLEKPAMIAGRYGSQTLVERLAAVDNGLATLFVEVGVLTVTNSSFTDNSVQLFGNLSVSACIHGHDASISIEDSEFRKNRGHDGAVILAEESDAGVTGCVFERNAATHGGVLHLLDGSDFLVQFCVFEGHSAEENGAVMYSSNSDVEIFNSRFAGNSAENGGCVYADEYSKVEMTACSFEENSGSYAGVAVLRDGSDGIITDCTFDQNTAAFSGGAVYVQDSELEMKNCNFTRGTAAFGGFLYARRASVDVVDSHFAQGTAQHDPDGEVKGGTEIHVTDVTLAANVAKGTGGAIHLDEGSTISIAESIFVDNAAPIGGGVFAASSRLTIRDTRISKNSAASIGGSLYLHDSSTLAISNITFRDNFAEAGGAIGMESESSGNATACRFLNNTAASRGGSFFADSASVQVRGSTFEQGAAEFAGFVYASEASVRVSDSTFVNASSSFGGCVVANRSSNVALYNVTVRKCSAAVDGGAIYSVEESTLRLEMSKLTDHVADRNGGAISASHATVIMKEAQVAGCSAVMYGGLLYASESSTLNLTSGVFTDGSASSGGAMCIEGGSTVEAIQSRFVKTSARQRGGSVFMNDSRGRFHQCRFAKGNASFGGLVDMGNNSSAEIADSAFQDGTADRMGGCLFSERGSFLLLQTTTMQDCNAAGNGGAIGLTTGTETELYDSKFSSNTASDNGGAIFATSSKLTGTALTFKDNDAGVAGGAIFLQDATEALLIDSTFLRNSAPRGGATALKQNASADFTECHFTDNSASQAGGASLIEGSRLEATRCIASGNDAGRGGCFDVTRSTIVVQDSELTDSAAALSGGFVLAQNKSSVVVRGTKMTKAAATQGGAIALRMSSMTGENMDISKSTARINGGAIDARDVSTVLCTRCRLSDNTAENTGGGVYFRSGEPQLLALQFDKSSFRRNVARHGGGLYFVGHHGMADCTEAGAECTIAAFSGTEFVENSANVAGGGIFSDDLQLLRFACRSESNLLVASFYSKEQWTSMQPFASLDDICPSWKGNSAERYGKDVASYARGVKKSIRFEGADAAVDVTGGSYMVKQHRSGTHLPAILFQAADDLGQGPAFALGNATVVAILSSPDGLIPGFLHVPLSEGDARVAGLASYAQPGTYKLNIEFSEASVQPFELLVEIRDCEIGEVPTENGTYCQPCSPSTYSLDPTDTGNCHPCPKNGNCDSRAIRSDSRYWHETPCSTALDKCLANEACDFSGRDDDLAKLLERMDTCDLDDAFISDYGDAQCKKGYGGRLCGSCEADYARSRAFTCKKCVAFLGSLVLFFVSSILLLTLSSCLVRSNLVSFVRMTWEKQSEPAAVVGGPSTSSNAPPVDIEEVTAWCEAQESKKAPVHRRQRTGSRIENNSVEAELAKYKAAEVFKIALNYLQVTAMAVSLNVDWPTTIVILFEAAQFLSGVTSEATYRWISCLMSEDPVEDRALIATLVVLFLPLAVICLFVTFWCVVKFRYRESVIYLMKKVLLSSIAVFYISFISLTKALISTLNCIEVHDFMNDSVADYWAEDTNVACYRGSHTILAAAVGWPFIFLFSAGFPAALAYVIVQQVKDDFQRGWVYDISGFLYRAYKKHFVFWDSIVMLRKALLAIVLVFSYSLGPVLQAVLAAFVLASASYSQALLRPYREEFAVLNELEALSLLASLLTFVAGLFFDGDRVPEGVRIPITIIMALCHLGLFLFFVGFFLSLIAKVLKTVLDKEDVPYDSDGEAAHILRIYCTDHIMIKLRGAVQRSMKCLLSPEHPKS